MMDPFKLTGTDEAPTIILDARRQIFEITGRSMPANVHIVYEPVINWLEKYLQDPNAYTEINFKLEYFNSATAKMITEILFLLEESVNEGVDIKVIWHFDQFDEVMESKGKDFMDIVEIPFETRAY